MKTIYLILSALLLPLAFHAQSLTGLWTGTLSNDSSTVRKDQSFEIVLTHYKDKVYGFSRMTFIVNDTLYYIVKRVKGTVEGDVCEVKDDDIISHNFPRNPDKGVKLISTFRRTPGDSTWRLDGDWKTTESKKHRYYAISGKISLKTEPDLEKSKLFPHLEELKLAEQVAFYQDNKKAQAVQALARQTPETLAPAAPAKKVEPKETVVKPNDIAKNEVKNGTIPAKAEPKQEKQVALQRTQTQTDIVREPVKQPAKEIIKETTAPAQVQKQPVVNEQTAKQPVKEIIQETAASVPVKTQPVVNEQPAKSPVKEPAASVIASNPVQQPATKAPLQTTTPVQTRRDEPVVTTTKPVTQQNTVTKQAEKPVEKTVETTEPKTVAKLPQPETVTRPQQTEVLRASDIKPLEVKPANVAVARLNERKMATPQTVLFHSDSLQLSLYDNGEVDGDTVSVMLNGELILDKQGLKTSAIKKTIYVPAGQIDSLTLVLYAENLGKYPPNTGLLVVHDGDDVYQVRFSADFQQNAAIVFRRKKN